MPGGQPGPGPAVRLEKSRKTGFHSQPQILPEPLLCLGAPHVKSHLVPAIAQLKPLHYRDYSWANPQQIAQATFMFVLSAFAKG